MLLVGWQEGHAAHKNWHFFRKAVFQNRRRKRGKWSVNWSTGLKIGIFGIKWCRVTELLLHLLAVKRFSIKVFVVCLPSEMRGYVSADRYFADIRNSHGYGEDMDSNFLAWMDTDTDTLPRIFYGYALRLNVILFKFNFVYNSLS